MLFNTYTTVHGLDLQPRETNVVSALFVSFYESSGREGIPGKVIANLTSTSQNEAFL